MEKIYDVRIIPLDGRPRLSAAHQQYMGGLFRFADENLRLTERFSRVADDTLRYEFTVNDPTVWTAPCTASIYWKRASGEIYEYACHEGNYSVHDMLTGARADEDARR